jgi:hypothetical protein
MFLVMVSLEDLRRLCPTTVDLFVTRDSEAGAYLVGPTQLAFGDDGAPVLVPAAGMLDNDEQARMTWIP